MRRWAAANPCAESERLLAKLCIQIAVNRMLRWAHCCRQRQPCWPKCEGAGAAEGWAGMGCMLLGQAAACRRLCPSN